LIGILVVTAVFGFIGFIFAQIIREYIFDIRLSMRNPYRLNISLKLFLISLHIVYIDRKFGINVIKNVKWGSPPLFVWFIGTTFVGTYEKSVWDEPFKTKYSYVRVHKLRDFIGFDPREHIETLDTTDKVKELDIVEFSDNGYRVGGDYLSAFFEKNGYWEFDSKLDVIKVTDDSIHVRHRGKPTEENQEYELQPNQIPIGQFNSE
jgi:hypothetical protein